MAFNYEYPYTDAQRYNYDWLINKVKELAMDWLKTSGEWTETQEAWEELKSYVTDYFNNLDVQEEINNKLEAMKADGTLFNIIKPLFNEYQQAIDVLSARMDTFTALGDGTTTGDAELADIRVDYTGHTWPNAGDAVRGVTSQLSSEIGDVKNDICSLSSIKCIPTDVNSYSGDMVEDIDFTIGKTIRISELDTLTIYNYKNKMSDSSTACISEVLKIRKGTRIEYVQKSSVLSDALVCITFDENGNFNKAYTGKELNGNELTNVPYAIFIIYTNANQEIKYTFFNKTWIENKIKERIDASIEKVFTVGVGGDYETFTECINAIHDDDSVKTIKVLPGKYDLYSEIGGDTYANTINSSSWRDWNLLIPPNTKIIGIGTVEFDFNCTSTNNTAIEVLSPINSEHNVTIENITINASNCRYAIHFENSGSTDYRNSFFGIYDCKITKDVNNIACIGVGLEKGSKLALKGDVIINNNHYGLYIHSDDGADNCSVSIYDCVIMSKRAGVILDNIYAKNSFMENQCSLVIGNSYLFPNITKRFNNSYDEWDLLVYNTNIDSIVESGTLIGDRIEPKIFNIIN